MYTSLEDRLRVVQIGSAWLSLEAASDILIAAALVIVLARYKRKTNFTQTKGLLAKLMLDAARTGSITASIAVGMLLAFLFSKTTNINTGRRFLTMQKCRSALTDASFRRLQLRSRQSLCSDSLDEVSAPDHVGSD